MLLNGTEAQAILADKAYDAQARVIEPLLKAGKIIMIPPLALFILPVPWFGLVDDAP